jgi:GNAT superfamily N-acetyltransferase
VSVEVRKAGREETGAIAEVLAAAFATDPVQAWVLGGRKDMERRLRIMFQGLLDRAASFPDHELYVTADGTGAALWFGVDRWKLSLGDGLRTAPAMWRSGFVNPRGLRLFAAMQRAHPAEPHFYLEIVGTHPDRRGGGVGSALLDAVLARCDEEGIPAYLENSNPRNTAFYFRHGFEAMTAFQLPSGCPPLIPMWRSPRSFRSFGLDFK